MVRRYRGGSGVLSQNADHANADSIALNYRVRLREWMVGAFEKQVCAEYWKWCPIFLPGKYFFTVVEFMITNSHGVIAHGDHELEHQCAVCQAR